jgi:predicted amidohydrolase YtcJ
VPTIVPSRRRPAGFRAAGAGPVADRLVAAGLVVAAALATIACRSTAPERADLILRGGVIRPRADGPPADALAILGGRVLAVGSERSILRHRGPDTRVVDLAGTAVVPGFGDAHARPVDLGESLMNDAAGGALYLDLRDAESEEDIVQRVRARSRALGPGEWILGAGWDERHWVAAHPPDKRLISDIVANNPALLVHAGGDPVWVNARALDAAGIDARTPDPPGGRIARERAGGAPAGLLWGRAGELVLKRVPRPSPEDRAAAILLGLKGEAALGVTMASVVATGGPLGLEDRSAGAAEVLGPWRDLAGKGRLPIRLSLLVPAPSAAAEALVTAGPEIGLGAGRLDIATILLDASGADDGAALGSWMGRARARGLGVAIRALDPQATRAAVAAIRAAIAGGAPGAARDAALRLDVGEAIDAADLGGMGSEAVLVVPAAAADGAIAPWAEARRAKIDLALAGGGRDAAWSPVDALAEVGAGWPLAAGAPDDQGRREALRMITLGPARAAGRGGESGCLGKGCRADFVILSRDPLAAPAAAGGPVKVLATWLDGKPTFSAAR